MSTSAEIYSAIFEPTYERVSRQFSNIRWNHMAAYGDTALKLALIGAAVTEDKPEATDAYLIHDYYQDFVTTGARLTFRMIKRVKHPSSLELGPGNFSVKPSDSVGRILEAREASAPEGFRKLSTPINTWWLGEDREDVWNAAAMGIATEVSLNERKIGKAQKAALRKAESSDGLVYANIMVANAAELTLQAVAASRVDGSVLKNLHVVVAPITGNTSKVHTLLEG